MLTLSLDTSLFARFPGLLVAGLCVERLDAAAACVLPGDLDALWNEARQALKERDVRLDTVSIVPEIAAWRRAFFQSGVKASTHRSSVEALVRRVLKDGSVATPLPVVTAYCAMSVIHLATMGGYDLGRLNGEEVAVRPARPAGDRFNPLGGRREDMPLTEGVVVYACADTVLCWSFNHRDSSDTSLLGGTCRAVFFSEAVCHEQQAGVRASLRHLSAWLGQRGAMPGAIAVASAESPVVNLK
jgi:DNA/RNA-binding domain of Phe-tRNA-synthetase-like protein